MSRSIPKTNGIPRPVWNRLSRLRGRVGALDDYPGDNAMMVGTLLYALIFPESIDISPQSWRFLAAQPRPAMESRREILNSIAP
jgi:hypothetical protein